MTTFHLTIASVGETKYDGEAQAAVFPGRSGEFTVLAHHEPFVSTLRAGSVRVRDAVGYEQAFEITTGLVEVSANHAIVLV